MGGRAGGRRDVVVSQETWDKIERVWRGDRLSLRLLGERFGINRKKIQDRFVRKFGSAGHGERDRTV